jgi:hypothetical protein
MRSAKFKLQNGGSAKFKTPDAKLNFSRILHPAF